CRSHGRHRRDARGCSGGPGLPARLSVVSRIHSSPGTNRPSPARPLLPMIAVSVEKRFTSQKWQRMRSYGRANTTGVKSTSGGHRLRPMVEVLAMVGDITTSAGKPVVHAHVVLGKSDGTAHGGHLIRAVVRPTLEVVLTETPRHLYRRFDPESGLPLIDPGLSELEAQ